MNKSAEFIDKVRQAMAGAISQRGPTKGRLKSKCPPLGSLSAVAWCAYMSNINPHKVGMGQLLFMDDEGREIFNHIDGVMSRLKNKVELLKQLKL